MRKSIDYESLVGQLIEEKEIVRNTKQLAGLNYYIGARRPKPKEMENSKLGCFYRENDQWRFCFLSNDFAIQNQKLIADLDQAAFALSINLPLPSLDTGRLLAREFKEKKANTEENRIISPLRRFFITVWPLTRDELKKTPEGCSRVLMLNKLPPLEEIDKDVFYLIKDTDKFTAYWYENGEMNPHKFEEKTSTQLKPYFQAGESIQRGKQGFDEITSLCGYPPETGYFYRKNGRWCFQCSSFKRDIQIQSRKFQKYLNQEAIKRGIVFPSFPDIGLELKKELEQKENKENKDQINITRYYLASRPPEREQLQANPNVGFICKSDKSDSQWRVVYSDSKQGPEKEIKIQSKRLVERLEEAALTIKLRLPTPKKTFWEKVREFFRSFWTPVDKNLEDLIDRLEQLCNQELDSRYLKKLTAFVKIDEVNYSVLRQTDPVEHFKELIRYALAEIKKNKLAYSTSNSNVIKITKANADSYSFLLTRNHHSGEWQLVLTPHSKRIKWGETKAKWIERLWKKKTKTGGEKNASECWRVDRLPVVSKFKLADKPEKPKGLTSPVVKEFELRKDVGWDKDITEGHYHQPEKGQNRTVMIMDKAKSDLFDHLKRLESSTELESADALFSEAMIFTLSILYGLAKLHDFGYVHRDVKFENFLVMEYKDSKDEIILYPKITDLSGMVRAGEKAFRKGTRPYFFPNVPVDGSSYKPLCTDDIYAASIMFTGNPGNPEKRIPRVHSLPGLYLHKMKTSNPSQRKLLEQLQTGFQTLRDDSKMDWKKPSTLSAQQLFDSICTRLKDSKPEVYQTILAKFEKIRPLIAPVDSKLVALIHRLEQLRDNEQLSREDIKALTGITIINGENYSILRQTDPVAHFKELIRYALEQISKNKLEYSNSKSDVIKITKANDQSYSFLLTRQSSGEWQLVLTPKSKRMNEKGKLKKIEKIHKDKKKGSEKSGSVGHRVDRPSSTPKFILTDIPGKPKSSESLRNESANRKLLGMDTDLALGSYESKNGQERTAMVVEKAKEDLLDHLAGESLESKSPNDLFDEAVLFTLCILYGLKQLHAKRYVHRDVKFENFLVMEYKDPDSGEIILYPHLSDFSTMVAPDQKVMPRGSGGYMPPYISKDMKKTYTPSCVDDIYALSVMFAGEDKASAPPGKLTIPGLPTRYLEYMRVERLIGVGNSTLVYQHKFLNEICQDFAKIRELSYWEKADRSRLPPRAEDKFHAFQNKLIAEQKQYLNFGKILADFEKIKHLIIPDKNPTPTVVSDSPFSLFGQSPSNQSLVTHNSDSKEEKDRSSPRGGLG